MDFQEKIRQQKLKLVRTETVVKSVSGEVVKEVRTGPGTDHVEIVKLPLRYCGFVVDMKPDLRVDKVVDGLLIGSQDVIQQINLLDEFCIKHVLSIGVEASNHFPDISYFYLDALDLPEFNMVEVFDKSYEIIDHVVRVKRENIYVHCNAGVSRSASVVIAYLMKSQLISYDKAFAIVKSSRNVINPNEGFVRQLKLYEQSCIS